MRALYQRLKELSKDDFESLIDQVVQARYPTAGITRVNGAGGDLGVDSYQGRLGGELAIWQDKHFPDGLGDVQRRQVNKSIAVAFTKNKPKLWTLCVPIDLNPTERKWFDENIVDLYSVRARIELMQASHIVFLLNNNYRNIRDTFFPGAVIDIERLKQLVMNVESLDPTRKATLGAEYLNQFTTSLEQRDGRFRYEVTVGGSQRTEFAPGLLASVFNGVMRTDLFAADVAALRDDPIRLIVQLSREAATKLDEAKKTGKGFSLGASELVGLKLPPPLQNLVGSVLFNNLSFVPRPIGGLKLMSTRISCGVGESVITYNYVKLKVLYQGTEEVTFVTESDLPFILTIKARLIGEISCETSIVSRYPGQDIAAVRKAYDFATAMFGGSSIEIFNLESDTILLKLTNGRDSIQSEQQKDIGALIEGCEIVAQYLGATFPYPSSEPTEEDYEIVETIKLLKSGQEFEINSINFAIMKDASLHCAYKELLQEGQSSQLYFEASPNKLARVLFGMPITLGRMLLSVDRLTVRNPIKTLRKFERAKDGTFVSVIVDGPTQGRYIDTAMVGVHSSSPSEVKTVVD